MITFNNIITALENFANNHFFIKSFGHGNIEEIDLDKFTQFPLLHVIYLGSTYDDGTKTYRFEIYIVDNPSDKIDKISYQREVISDSEQCAEDLLADLTNGGQIFGFWEYELTNATITPLEEETKNVLSGVVLDIEIQVPYQYDSCNAPLTGVTPTDSCADADVEVNGNAYGSVASGSLIDVLVRYVNGTPVGTIVGNVVQIPNPIVCDPGDVENSDQTYTNTVASGGTLVLPDITITDQNAATSSYPSVKNFDIRTLKLGILYRAPLYTQKTSYATGDEGNNIANGVYDYSPPLYPDVIQDLDYSVTAANVYYTLKFNNSFGNKFRFTNGSGADLSGAGTTGIIIDHLYNLMWYGTQQGAASSWSNAFTVVGNANGTNPGGFNNWRLPTKGEWWSILEEHNASTAFRHPFSNWTTALYWTSTTNPATSTQALSVFNGRLISTSTKTTNNLRVVLVRKYS